jgi:hypothetical protein
MIAAILKGLVRDLAGIAGVPCSSRPAPRAWLQEPVPRAETGSLFPPVGRRADGTVGVGRASAADMPPGAGPAVGDVPGIEEPLRPVSSLVDRRSGDGITAVSPTRTNLGDPLGAGKTTSNRKTLPDR